MKKHLEWISRLASHRFFPIALLLIANLCLGAVVVTDYGESWDEQLRYRYASDSIAAYFGQTKDLKDEKGPFFVMVAKVGGEALRFFHKGWQPIEAWHFMIFLSFQMGAFFLFLLSRRLIQNKWGAAGSVLLFTTQPLLWGHAFINPKDIPFMAFFLGSVTLGLEMVYRCTAGISLASGAGEVHPSDAEARSRHLATDWRALSRKTRAAFLTINGISVGGFIGIILAGPHLRAALAGLVRQAYWAEPSSLLGQLFARFAENTSAVPVESYVQKTLALYPRAVLLCAGGVLLLNLLVAWRRFPTTAAWLWYSHIRPFLQLLKWSFTQKSVVGAGVFLGLSTSIRVLGPLSGLLVAGVFGLKAGRRAVPIVIACFTIAAAVTYVTWPGLWGSPLKAFLYSFSQAADFSWDGKVMFTGTDYSIEALPRSYLPVLLALQFTEPALVLFVAGVAIAAVRFYKGSIEREIVLLAASWLLAPIAAAMLFQPTMYDNFRHFLFVVPPIFLFAGLGMQALFDRLEHISLTALMLVVLLLPGLHWTVKLHPYQYIYYNSLAGGVRGAFRRYEMDYWATSYREATRYLNEFAPAHSKVVVWGPDHLVRAYARADLVIEKYSNEGFGPAAPPDFAIILARHNKDLALFPEARQLWTIGRGGATFAVVKQLNPADAAEP